MTQSAMFLGTVSLSDILEWQLSPNHESRIDRILSGDENGTGKTARHDPANRRECCKECNGDLEFLRLELLIKKYPLSPLQAEWKERLSHF